MVRTDRTVGSRGTDVQHGHYGHNPIWMFRLCAVVFSLSSPVSTALIVWDSEPSSINLTNYETRGWYASRQLVSIEFGG